MKSTNVDNFHAFIESNQVENEAQEDVANRRNSNASESSNNVPWSDLDLGGKYRRLVKWAAMAVIVCSSLVSPPLMIYSGISHIHCDDLWPPWFFIGAFIWYLEIAAYVSFCKLRFERNKCGWLLIINSLLFFIWWMLGFVRIYGPARSISRGYSNTIDDFDDPIMKDDDCKLHMFYVPFAIVSIPAFLFMGWVLHMLFSFVICFSIVCICERLLTGVRE